MKKLELVENWRNFTKFWSVRFSMIGAALMGLFTVWPDSALYLWAAMPDEVRAMIPQSFVSMIALFVFALSSLSRIVKQKKLTDEQARNERTAEHQDESAR